MRIKEYDNILPKMNINIELFPHNLRFLLLISQSECGLTFKDLEYITSESEIDYGDWEM